MVRVSRNAAGRSCRSRSRSRRASPVPLKSDRRRCRRGRGGRRCRASPRPAPTAVGVEASRPPTQVPPSGTGRAGARLGSRPRSRRPGRSAHDRSMPERPDPSPARRGHETVIVFTTLPSTGPSEVDAARGRRPREGERRGGGRSRRGLPQRALWRRTRADGHDAWVGLLVEGSAPPLGATATLGEPLPFRSSNVRAGSRSHSRRRQCGRREPPDAVRGVLAERDQAWRDLRGQVGVVGLDGVVHDHELCLVGLELGVVTGRSRHELVEVDARPRRCR